MARTGRQPRGQPEERRQKRRDALLDAALDLFAAKGYSNVSIEMICQHAAVGYKAFYDEFTSKEQLFLALYDSIGAQLLPVVINALDPSLAPPDQLRVVIGAFAAALMENPRAAKVLFVTSAGVSEAVDLHRRTAHRAFAGFFYELYRTGRVAELHDRDGEHSHALSMGITGGMGEIIVDYLLDPERGDPELLAESLYQFVSAFLFGLNIAADPPG